MTNVPRTFRGNAVAYAALAVLFAVAITYQVRVSLDTVRVERTYEFYVPFVFAPFTNRIADIGYFMSWESGTEPDPAQRSVLHRGDEVLSVNGQPFRGVSMYLRELLKSEHQRPPDPPNFEWHPFVVTARSSDKSVRRVEVGFPHCTCGVPTLFEAISVWFAPPLFCVILGFATACLRPRTTLAWAFLGVMLSLSQAQLWPEWYTGFQLTSTPMIWGDWFRVVAVGYRALVQAAWPVALLLGSAQFYRTRRLPYRLAMGMAALFLLHAVLQASLQVAWSEDYRMLGSLHEFLRTYGTELIVASVVAAGTLAWTLNRRFGIGALALGSMVVAALYWSAMPITHGEWYNYSDGTRRFVAAIPAFHNTPAVITMLFVVSALILVLLFFRRNVALHEVLGFLLCLPLVVDYAARLGCYWWPFERGFFQYWLWLVLALAGLGLISLSCSVLRRARIDGSSTVFVESDPNPNSCGPVPNISRV